MAKTATDTSTAPLRHGAGESILEETIREVVEAQNFVVCQQTTVYISTAVDELFYDDSTDFPVFSGWFWIDPDYQNLSLRARVELPTASQEVEVRFDIGARNSTCIFTGTGTLDEESFILALAPADVGWQEFTITITHTVGTAADCRLTFIAIENIWLDDATDLPDPTG